MTRALFLLALGLLLQACGGSGGDASEPPATSLPQLSGTVTDGLSTFARVEVTVKGRSGLARTSLNNRAGDSHVTSLNQLEGPYLLRAALTDGVAVFSVATQPGQANLSPLTTLVVARLLGEDPETFFSALGASGGVPAGITGDAVRDAQAQVRRYLARAHGLVLPTTGDVITTPFEARPGDAGYDAVRALNAALAQAGSDFTAFSRELALQAQRCRLQQVLATRAEGSVAAEFCPAERTMASDPGDATVSVHRFADALGDEIVLRLRGDEVLSVLYRVDGTSHECSAPACQGVVPGTPAGDGSRTVAWTAVALAGPGGSLALNGSLVTAAPGVQLPPLPCTENFFHAIAADQSVEGLCVAGFSATRGTRRQLYGFGSVDGTSPLQLEITVQDGTQVASVLLLRPDPDSGEPRYFRCTGAACSGVTVGAPDDFGLRLVTLDDTPLSAVQPDGTPQAGVAFRLRGSMLNGDAATDFSTNCTFSTEDVALQFSDEAEAAHLCPPTDEFAAATGFAFRGSFDLGGGNLGFFAASFFGDEFNVALADGVTVMMQADAVASVTLNRRDGQVFACSGSDCAGVAVSAPDGAGRRTLVFSAALLRELTTGNLPGDRSVLLDGSFSVSPP